MAHEQLASEHNPLLPLEIAGGLQRVIHELPQRDYSLNLQQELAIQAIGESLASGTSTGHITMATSTGKTTLLSMVAEAATRANKRVLILAPTKTVADQLYGEDGRTGLGRFTDLHDGRRAKQHYGTRRAGDGHQVVVTTYQGLLGDHTAAASRLGNFDLILADECHRSLGEKTADAMRNYMPQAVRIGFTATPDYGADRKSEEVYDTPFFSYSLRTAVEDGVTAPVQALVVETGASLVVSDMRKDFTDLELAPLIKNMERNGIALQFAADFVKEGRQGIIACVPGLGNAHARLLAELLRTTPVAAAGRTIVAADIGAHLSVSEQKQRLLDYRRGKIDVLTFTRSLEEGWDSDKASFCINLSPTTSPVRTEQLLGRILRRKADGSGSIYIDFVDDKKGLAKHQYTALHALDLQDIQIHRILGRHRGDTPHGMHATKDISELLSPALYRLLLASQGKLVEDVVVNAQAETLNPLFAQWGRTLAKDGLPSVLPENITFTPAFDKKFTTIVNNLRRLGIIDEVSSMEEIVAQVLDTPKLTTNERELLGSFAVQETLDNSEVRALADPDEDVPRLAEVTFLRETIDRVLNTLPEREEITIRGRFGLSGVEPQLLDEIGTYLGVTRERVRQIESKALSRLKHASRAKDLAPFFAPLPEEPPVSSESPLRAANSFEASLFKGLKEVPAIPIDTYLERLGTYCEQRRSTYQQAIDATYAGPVVIHGQSFENTKALAAHYRRAAREAQITSGHLARLPMMRLMEHIWDKTLTVDQVAAAFDFAGPADLNYYGQFTGQELRHRIIQNRSNYNELVAFYGSGQPLSRTYSGKATIHPDRWKVNALSNQELLASLENIEQWISYAENYRLRALESPRPPHQKLKWSATITALDSRLMELILLKQGHERVLAARSTQAS